MSQSDPHLWNLIQMLTGGLAGLIIVLLYIIAIIQLCRAKFFLLQMTDTFLFYFTFGACCITTLTFFIKIFAIWNLEHSIDLLLQVVFFLIFALIIDPHKRIYLLWKSFKIAAFVTTVFFSTITLIEYLEAIQTLQRGWPCSGFLGIIMPCLTLLVSIALTITAFVVMCRTKQPTPVDQYSQLLDMTPEEGEHGGSPLSFNKYIKMKSMRIKRAHVEQRKVKQQHSFSFKLHHQAESHQQSQISSIDRKATIRKYKQFLTLTKTTNIEKLVADYCYASQKELKIKRTEILTLIIINLSSILLTVGVGIYLIYETSPSFLPVHKSKVCVESLEFPLWKTLMLNLLRMLGEYSTIVVVFYNVFWKHRHAARGDSLESSFDFIIESDQGEPAEGFLLLNEAKQDEEASNSEGDNFADWIQRKDSDKAGGDRKSNTKLKKRKHSEAESMRQRNSSVQGQLKEPRNSKFGSRPEEEGEESLKREESHESSSPWG